MPITVNADTLPETWLGTNDVCKNRDYLCLRVLAAESVHSEEESSAPAEGFPDEIDRSFSFGPGKGNPLAGRPFETFGKDNSYYSSEDDGSYVGEQYAEDKFISSSAPGYHYDQGDAYYEVPK